MVWPRVPTRRGLDERTGQPQQPQARASPDSPGRFNARAADGFGPVLRWAAARGGLGDDHLVVGKLSGQQRQCLGDRLSRRIVSQGVVMVLLGLLYLADPDRNVVSAGGSDDVLATTEGAELSTCCRELRDDSLPVTRLGGEAGDQSVRHQRLPDRGASSTFTGAPYGDGGTHRERACRRTRPACGPASSGA
jgi:hypothetical protein